MPSKDTKLVGFNQYQKSGDATPVIYADLEPIIEKINGCKHNPENSSAATVMVSMVFQCLQYHHLKA